MNSVLDRRITRLGCLENTSGTVTNAFGTVTNAFGSVTKPAKSRS